MATGTPQTCAAWVLSILAHLLCCRLLFGLEAEAVQLRELPEHVYNTTVVQAEGCLYRIGTCNCKDLSLVLGEVLLEHSIAARPDGPRNAP